MNPADVLKPNRWALPLSLITGVLLGTCVLLAAKINNSPPVSPYVWRVLGIPIPALELEGLDGQPLSTQVFKGQNHILVLGQPGCTACSMIYPALQEVSKQAPVLLIFNEDREAMQAKAEEYGLTFSIGFDTLKTMQETLGIRSYPTTLIIDSEGGIVRGWSGARSEVKATRQALVSALEEVE